MSFTIRPFRPDDAESFATFGNNLNVARFMTDSFPHPYTVEKARAFIEYANSKTPVLICAIDVEGKAIGGIGIHPQNDIHSMNAELGYWLGEPFWGKGIATSAVKQMVQKAFAQLQIQTIYARPYGNNIASQRVLEKAGFTREAVLKNFIYKNGEFLDEIFYVYRRGS